MDDDVKSLIMNHEGRIAKLEAEVRSMNSWMKSIDKKLDNVSDLLYYMKGELRDNNKGIGRKAYWGLLTSLLTNMGLLFILLFKVMIR